MRENSSKEDIFNCALRLFAEKGYDAVSPNEIVETVGVKKQTLYYFFGSKEGLFEMILKTCYEKLETTLTACCRYVPNPKEYEQDVYPALERVVSAYFRFVKENTDFYSMVMAMGFMPPSSKSALVAEQYQHQQYRILQTLFEDISAAHPNLKGKERICVWRFFSCTH